MSIGRSINKYIEDVEDIGCDYNFIRLQKAIKLLKESSKLFMLCSLIDKSGQAKLQSDIIDEFLNSL